MSDTVNSDNYKRRVWRETHHHHHLYGGCINDLVPKRFTQKPPQLRPTSNNSECHHRQLDSSTGRWFTQFRLGFSNRRSRLKNALDIFFKPWKVAVSLGRHKSAPSGCMPIMGTEVPSIRSLYRRKTLSEESASGRNCSSALSVLPTELPLCSNSTPGLQMRILQNHSDLNSYSLQEFRLETKNDADSGYSSSHTPYASLPADPKVSEKMMNGGVLVQDGSSSEPWRHEFLDKQYPVSSCKQTNQYAIVHSQPCCYDSLDKQDSMRPLFDYSVCKAEHNYDEGSLVSADRTCPSNTESVKQDGEPANGDDSHFILHDCGNEDKMDGFSEDEEEDEEGSTSEEPISEQVRDGSFKEDDIWSDENLISRQGKGFPPPISILANETHPGLPVNVPRTLWRSVKRGGRFVLQEVQAQPREFFQATRENGRLLLQLVRPDSDVAVSVGSHKSESENIGETSETIPDLETNSSETLGVDKDCGFKARADESSPDSISEYLNNSILEKLPILEHDCQKLTATRITETMFDDSTFDTSVMQETSEDSTGRSDASGVLNDDSKVWNSQACIAPKFKKEIISNLIEGSINHVFGKTSPPMDFDHKSETFTNRMTDIKGILCTKLEADQVHSPPNLDHCSIGIGIVTPKEGHGANEDQFKQDYQHTCFQTTYGFDTNVKALSPSNAFFQFPIQPVVR